MSFDASHNAGDPAHRQYYCLGYLTVNIVRGNYVKRIHYDGTEARKTDYHGRILLIGSDISRNKPKSRSVT